MKRLKRDRRGVSNIIVVVLGLVIVIAIVSNVVLWSYEMNQLDWEKIREDVAITDVSAENETGVFNPAGYALEGSTTWISGGITDLEADDDFYMTFRSYYSGADTSDFVDSNTSDVDASADKGTHANFTEQQTGPDAMYDTLTEENTGGLANTTFINIESFEGAWPPTGWIETGRWDKESDQAYDGTYSADFDGWFGVSGDLTIPDLDCSDASAIHVDFWYRDGGCESNEFLLQYYDGTSWDTISDLGATTTEDQWIQYQEKVTDSQYFKSDFKIRWTTNTSAWSDDAFVDFVTVKKEVGNPNYELDVEVQWTNADYDETNEELAIYLNSSSTENIRVDVWDGTTWQNLFTDLGVGWNNVTCSSYLIAPTFTIRLKGSNETSDTTQDSWNIDVTLLHVWSDEHICEVEFTGSSNTEEWNQLNWTVNSAWTNSSINVTLQLYNYTLGGYPTSGNGYMAYTSDSTPNTEENRSQTITVNPTQFRNATGYWKLKIRGVGSAQFDLNAEWIEFTGTKSGTRFTFKNLGAPTVHLVSLWVNNATHHERYDLSIFLNAGDTKSYIREDIGFPENPYVVKVVTEKGNMAIYAES